MQWEMGDDDPGPAMGDGNDSGQPFVRIFQGPGGERRVAAVRRGLARAVEEWWRLAELPPIGLLRDALLVLEAGHSLNDSERTLLLRASLFYGKGMLTALKHQPDPERTASVMRDMLLNPQRPLPPAQIQEIAQQDEESHVWRQPLLDLLQMEAAQSLEPRRTLAAAARLYLQGEAGLGPDRWTPLSRATRSASTRAPSLRLQKLRRGLSTLLFLLAALLGVAALFFFWQAFQQSLHRTGDLVEVPGGVYAISANPIDSVEAPTAVGAGQERLVQLGAFAIDRNEVTNQAYRRCYEAGGCPWPKRVTSITRPTYFLDPAFTDYPVVNVSWTDASAYCDWAGKRLPLEEEWEVAASAALTLRRHYRYPWGDTFDTTLVNGNTSGIGDTQMVGAHSPAGDSPVGLADMAGNAAEWTATPGDEVGTYIVKGGSFMDGPIQLQSGHRQSVDAQSYHPWLGFRCARTLPD